MSSLPLQLYKHDFPIQLGSFDNYLINFSQNLGVIFDDQLTFKEHIARLLDLAGLHYTTSERTGPSLPQHAKQLLVQALVISRLDYCNALLSWTSVMHNQTFTDDQNVAARLVFNEPKRAHVTPLFSSLHWLLVAAHIKFKTLMLAYRTTTGSAPSYFHSLSRIYIPSRSPAYFHSLSRIYIPSRSPAYFHSLSRNLHPLQKRRDVLIMCVSAG